MDKTIVVAIIVALAGIIGHFITHALDRGNDLRTRKIQVYTELLEATQAALLELKNKEAVTFKAEVTSKVVTWGSHEVVFAYAVLRDDLRSQEPNVPKIKELFGNLLAGIRKDLGHADRLAPARFDELTAMLFFADV